MGNAREAAARWLPARLPAPRARAWRSPRSWPRRAPVHLQSLCPLNQPPALAQRRSAQPAAPREAQHATAPRAPPPASWRCPHRPAVTRQPSQSPLARCAGRGAAVGPWAGARLPAAALPAGERRSARPESLAGRPGAPGSPWAKGRGLAAPGPARRQASCCGPAHPEGPSTQTTPPAPAWEGLSRGPCPGQRGGGRRHAWARGARVMPLRAGARGPTATAGPRMRMQRAGPPHRGPRPPIQLLTP